MENRTNHPTTVRCRRYASRTRSRTEPHMIGEAWPPLPHLLPLPLGGGGRGGGVARRLRLILTSIREHLPERMEEPLHDERRSIGTEVGTRLRDRPRRRHLRELL